MPVRGLVCGYWPNRANRLLFMLKAYLDDSGRGQGPSLVLSGYVSTAEQWEVFSREWRAELDVRPSVEYFKTKEAMWREGQFSHHRPELITYRINKLAGIVKANVLLGIACAVSLKDFYNIIDPFFKAQPDHPMARVNGNPYFFCFYGVMTLLYHHLWRKGRVEPVDFIFDEQGKEGNRIADFYYDFRDTRPLDMVGKMMVNPPIFQNDRYMLPLQAADLSAWHIRRYLADAEKNKKSGLPRPELSPIQAKLAEIAHIDMTWGPKTMRQYLDNYEKTMAGFAARRKRTT